MIKYALICENGHEFEGWFPDSAGFEAQLAKGLVGCPHCPSLSVRRALMAPALSSPKTRSKGPARPPAAETGQPEAATAPQQTSQMMAGDPAGQAGQMLQMLREMHRVVRSECRPVGDKFAEEALKIHRGEAEAEPIWGNCTTEERAELEEEGVDFAELPTLPRDN
jgi:hypothetical protein